MRATCPKWHHALTIRDVIQNTCSKCASRGRSGNGLGKETSSRSNIKANFDVLISRQLKKRTLKTAAWLWQAEDGRLVDLSVKAE